MLPSFLSAQHPKDVINADKCALFFSILPHKNESCHRGKRSKDRITVFMCKYGWTQKDAITGSQNNNEVKVLRACEVTAMYIYNNSAWISCVLFRELLICLEW
jgi:hypothetical protein